MNEIKPASEKLHSTLEGYGLRPGHDFTVGIAESATKPSEIHVYLHRRKQDGGYVPTSWEGWPVKCHWVGAIRPAAQQAKGE